jgi:RNase P/RNase MRP subunit POP5
MLFLESNPYEKRAFVYFDIISWLESKIERRTVQEVIQEKARKRLEKNNNNQSHL